MIGDVALKICQPFKKEGGGVTPLFAGKGAWGAKEIITDIIT
jgi:hypothetical protein